MTLNLYLNSMKFKNPLLILLICCFYIQTIAQNNKAAIEEIQAHYYALKQKMKASADAEYPMYYIVKIEENVDKMSMPAVGNYYGTDEFLYLPDEAVGTYGKEGILVYRKSEFQIAARTEWKEYVFKNGKLVFCFVKIDKGGEYRYYFKDDILVKYTEKDAEDGFYNKEDGKYLLKYAKE